MHRLRHLRGELPGRSHRREIRKFVTSSVFKKPGDISVKECPQVLKRGGFMITGKYLVAVSIWLPVAAALLCWLGQSYSLRNIVLYLTGIILAVCALGLFLSGPFDYQPGEIWGLSWNTAISAADFALLALILYIGWRQRHKLIIILAAIQALLLICFDFGLGGSEIEPVPAFAVDHLAIIMALIINIVGSLICIYGVKYIAEHEEQHPVAKSRQPRFMFWLIIFLGAMNGLVFANNLYWMYFFWEVTTFCSFQLIGHDQSDEAIGNACRALWMNSLGGAAFALGLVILLRYGGGDYLSMQYLLSHHTAAGATGAILLAVSMLVLAGMTKSAQLPFQSWLLGAMVAPTPVSALLHSSTMVKAGVYLILRLAPVYAGTYLSSMTAIAGAFTFLAASVLAISQSNAKRVLAYSTVANLGLIIACAGINTPTAISAAIVLIIFHAVSKGLLFLCTGYVEHEIGSRDIEAMEGLADRLPAAATIFTIGIISMFLPPFGMLVGKWAAIESAAQLPLAAFLLVLASAVTALFWLKWLGRMLEGRPGAIAQREIMDSHYIASLGGLTAAAVLLSIFIGPVVNSMVTPAVTQYYFSPGLEANLETIAAGSGGLFSVWPLFILLALIAVAAGFLYQPRKVKNPPVYLCGENAGLPESTVFMTTGENMGEVKLSNYYFTGFLNEARWSRVVNRVGLIMILLLLGVTLW